MARKPHSFSAQSRQALLLLGAQIKLARITRGWTQAEVASRIGAHRTVVARMERGDPNVAIGTVFEAATILGVPLFDEAPEVRALEARRLTDHLALLPAVARAPTIPDDF